MSLKPLYCLRVNFLNLKQKSPLKIYLILDINDKIMVKYI